MGMLSNPYKKRKKPFEDEIDKRIKAKMKKKTKKIKSPKKSNSL